MSEVSLKALLIPEKTVTLEYDDVHCDGFKVDLCHVAREELNKLRKSCVTTKLDRKTRQPVEDFDEDKFLDLYIDKIIKGWSGLKYRYLEELLLVNVTNQDPDDCLIFNADNARTLMQNSTEFDSWVTSEASNLENFTTNK